MALQGFNKEYYLTAKLDALQSDPATSAEWQGSDTVALEQTLINDYGLTPEEHYIRYGYQEGLAPNAYFNSEEYIYAKAQDMVNDGSSDFNSIDEARDYFLSAWNGNVYQHYLEYGASEGINPSNDFDSSAYLQAKLADLQTNGETQYQSTQDVLNAFDAAGLTPLGHFLAYGQAEGLSAPTVPVEEAVPDEGGEFLLVKASAEAQTSFGPNDLDGYRAVLFSGFNDRTQQINITGVEGKRVYVEDSAMTLNLNKMSSAQVELASSDVLLYGDTGEDNLTPTGMLQSLGLTVTSNSSLELGASAAAGLANVTVDGAGSLALSGNALPQGANLDASAMTASLDVNGGVLDDAATVTAGSGDDQLTVDDLGTVNADYTSTPSVSIDGGAGNDKLTVTSAMTIDQVPGTNADGEEVNDINSGATVSADVTNVETVIFQGYVEVDAQDFTGTNDFTFASGGSISNINGQYGQIVTATAGNVPDGQGGLSGSPLILRDAGDTVNVSTVFPTGNETLDLRVYDDSEEGTGTGGTLNLWGSGAVTYDEAGRQFGTIDATNLFGGLDFTGAAYVQEGIRLGAGSDKLNVANNSIVGSDGDRIDSITGFDSTNDTLDIGTVSSFASADVSGAASLTEALESAATASAANANDYVTFEFDGNTYVYADTEIDSTDAEGNVTEVNGEAGVSYNDFAIQLAGIPSDTEVMTLT
ncbi:hypothetical protein GCM10027040_21970 [Halomonas shantousis]